VQQKIWGLHVIAKFQFHQERKSDRCLLLAIENQAIGELFGERLINCLALKLAAFEFGFSCDANGFS